MAILCSQKLNTSLSLRDAPEPSYGVSYEAEEVTSAGLLTYWHLVTPVSRKPLREKFNDLAATWKNETSHMSSVSKMITHPAYLEIIGMGREAVRFILQELQNDPDLWFWALRAITGVNPIAKEDRGKVDEMVAAWLGWGKTNGYI